MMAIDYDPSFPEKPNMPRYYQLMGIIATTKNTLGSLD